MPQEAFHGYVLQFGGSFTNRTAVTYGSTYAVAENDTLLTVATTGGTTSTTITLPALSTSLIGRVITIVDIGGNASTDSVVINASGGNNINSGGSFTLNQNFESVTLYASSATRWVILNNQA